MPRQLKGPRTCSKCGSADNGFFKDSRVSDGLTSWCKPCFRDYQRERRQRPELREHLRALGKKYYDADPAKAVASTKRYQRENPDRVRESRRAYFDVNRIRVYAKNSARARRIRQSTPPWVDRFLIEETYSLAKLRTQITGIEWHVDHIVPLKGKTVCGLTVPANLRVIPAQLNLRKGSKEKFCAL